MNTVKLKAGDVVHVRAVVDEHPYDADGDVRVLIKKNKMLACGFIFEMEGCFSVCPDQIVHVEPRPLKVGDMTQFGEIIAINKHEAWIKRNPVSGCFTYPLSRLVPA